MAITFYLFGLIGLYFLIMGVIQLITGKLFGEKKTYEIYTPESIKIYARISGALDILVGILLAGGRAYSYFKGFNTFNYWQYWLPTVLAIACLLCIMIFGYGVILKKKSVSDYKNTVIKDEPIAEETQISENAEESEITAPPEENNSDDTVEQ